MIVLPSMIAKLVDLRTGQLMPPWNSYFQQFTQPPASVIDITVGSSPFAYSTRIPGQLIISGGTVTAITLTRGTVVLTLAATNNLILMGINDIVTVTYTVLPTIKFVPLYGIAVR